jgi:hypothetical protein
VFLLQSASISVGAARAPFREFLREFFREFSRKPSRNTPTCRPYTGRLKKPPAEIGTVLAACIAPLFFSVTFSGAKTWMLRTKNRN